MKTKQQLQTKIRREKRAVLLVNTHSRQGKLLYKEAQVELKRRGFELTETYAITNPRKLNETIEAALASKPSLLIVGSGDGTVSEVVDHLAYADTVLGFLPLGTTNNFGRSLGLPFALDEAIDVIVDGKVADIDLGKVGDDHFANVASIGLSVHIARNVTSQLKRRIGRMAYAFTGAKGMLGHKPFKTTLEADGERHEFETHQVVIANGRFHGGTLIAKDASIDSGELVIFRLGSGNKAHLAKSLAAFALGRRKSLSDDAFITGKDVTISTHPVRSIEIDGEIKAKTPVKISIATNALRIMVPASFEDD